MSDNRIRSLQTGSGWGSLLNSTLPLWLSGPAISAPPWTPITYIWCHCLDVQQSWQISSRALKHWLKRKSTAFEQTFTVYKALSYSLSHLILPGALGSRWSQDYYFHFTDEETEAQRVEIIYPESSGLDAPKPCFSLSTNLDLAFLPKWELNWRLAKLSRLALVAGYLRVSL